MGAVVAAPVSAILECFGTCLGGCLGVCCCQLARSGNLRGAKASRFMLMWLQVLAVSLAWLLSSTAEQWLPQTCNKIGAIGLGSVGICDCVSISGSCSKQMVYRAEASVAAVFAALLGMAISGCADGAAKFYCVAKFMAVLLLIFVSLFLPNELFDGFGILAVVSSAIFLVVQAVLLVDFAYTCNESFNAGALRALREVGPRRQKAWRVAQLLVSAVFLVGSIIVSSALYGDDQDGGTRAVVVSAMVLSFCLLILGLTDLVNCGILPSSVVMAYTAWLLCSVVSALPSWAELSLGAVTILALALGAGGFGYEAAGPSTGREESLAAEAGEAGVSTPTTEESGQGVSSAETKNFAIQCIMHITAALYAAYALAPADAQISKLTYGMNVTATFVSIGLFGWSMVAPLVLTSRQFAGR